MAAKTKVKVKSDLRFTQNPCLIYDVRSFEDAQKADDSGIYLGREYDANYNPVLSQVDKNAHLIIQKWQKVTELFKKNNLTKYTNQLAYSLVPVFGDKQSEFNNSRIGGIPDLRNFLYLKKDLTPDKLNRLWPKCGVCHENLAFIGQYDLLDWLLPIYTLTSFYYGDWYPWLLSGIGGRELVDHHQIFTNNLWHFFTCKNTSHWDNPNCDAQVLMTKEWKSEKLKMSVEEWTDIYNKSRIAEENTKLEDWQLLTPNLTVKTVTGFEFKFAWDGVYKIPSAISDKMEDIVEANDDLFDNSYTDYTLFGAPRSQQDPKRYWGQSGDMAHRMTPTLSFNDLQHDMTYQLYFDLAWCRGHEAYGKMDSSCT